MKFRFLGIAFFLMAGGMILAGCSSPESTPSPSPAAPTSANGTPTKANDPRVLNDPNVPDAIKQQIRGGAPTPPK